MPFGAFVQVGDGIEGLVHISEMSAHHVDLPEQVVTPGEELWVKIIDLDLARRRISLSIKQAAEGGEVAEEYREHFGEHAYDEQGNYIGYDTSPVRAGVGGVREVRRCGHAGCRAGPAARGGPGRGHDRRRSPTDVTASPVDEDRRRRGDEKRRRRAEVREQDERRLTPSVRLRVVGKRSC